MKGFDTSALDALLEERSWQTDFVTLRHHCAASGVALRMARNELAAIKERIAGLETETPAPTGLTKWEAQTPVAYRTPLGIAKPAGRGFTKDVENTDEDRGVVAGGGVDAVLGAYQRVRVRDNGLAARKRTRETPT